jgi:adenosylcobinamide-GDP ribazoletransferase
MRAALSTLTRVPVGVVDGTGVAAFGIVGGVVGLAGALPMIALDGALAPVGAILAVAAMALVTGALHLDGLADTADALMAPDPAHAERARKDPSLGVAGGLVLIAVLALDVTALVLLAGARSGLVAGLTCVAAAACSRVIVVAVAWLARGRANDGWGGAFARSIRLPALMVAGLSTAVLVGLVAALVSPVVGVGAASGSALGLVVSGLVIRARRQLDGDGLGATVELTMAAILLATTIAADRIG